MPDYAALAAQARGEAAAPDYAALASQARGDSSVPATSSGFGLGSVARGAEALAGYLKDALPTAGGVIGSLVGGVPGATIGGAAGSGIRGLIDKASEIPGAISDVAANELGPATWTLDKQGNRVPVASGAAGASERGALSGMESGALAAAGQGAGQGIADLAGQGAVKVAGKVAGGLMGAASKATKATLEQFPDIAQTMLENGLSYTKSGLAKAQMLLQASGKDEGRALADLDASGKTIPIQWTPDLAEMYRTAVVSDAVKSGKVAAQGLAVGDGAPLTVASNRLDPLTAAHLASVDAAGESGAVGYLRPSQANRLKDQAQLELTGAYKQARSLSGRKPIGLADQEMMDFTRNLNDAIDTPGSPYRVANATAQPLIGARNAIQQTLPANTAGAITKKLITPSFGMLAGGGEGYREGGVPGAVAGAAAAALASTPGMLSGAAAVLAHPAVQAVLRQLPKGVLKELSDLFGTPAEGSQ